jgi:hypothetical protein
MIVLSGFDFQPKVPRTAPLADTMMILDGG